MKTILTALAVLCCATLFSQAGSLDSTFGNGGKFIYSANNYPYYFNTVNAMSIQKDGKIILAGFGVNYNGNGTQDFAVLRLNTNGSVDNTFGNNGLVLIDFSYDGFSYSSDIASRLTIQQDGKIVVAGEADGYNYIDSSSTYNYSDIAVARLNTDGSLDNTFNGKGKVKIDLSRYSNGGNSNSYNYDHCYAVTTKSNGEILLGGTTYTSDPIIGNNYDAVVIEVKVDGSLDSSFSDGGVLYIKKPGGDDNITGLAIQNGGKIICAGNTYNAASFNDLLALRLKTNGVIDKTFGSNGTASIDLNNNSYDYGTSLVLQANGKILLGCYTNSSAGSGPAVVKLNSNGALDNTFNGTGKTFYYSNDIVGQRQISVQKDGKIIQSGTQYSYNSADANYLGGDNFIIIRYKANGAIDSSFGTLGRSVVDFGNYTGNIYQDDNSSCAIQTDGKIVAAGTIFSNNLPCAVRLRPNGKNYGLSGPNDQSDTLANGNCSATFNNLDPVLYPDTSLSIVKYALYNNNNNYLPFDSGYGTVSGKTFNIGNTTVVYTSTIDPLQRSVFTINVAGGTPAGALDFDGVNDRVDISYLNPINSFAYGQYSFEGWIKVRGYNQNGSVIFGDERNNNGGILVQLDSKGYISTYQPNVGTVVSKYKVPLNKWTHIAFVQSSAKLDLYVNGKFVQTLLTAPYLHVNTYSNFYLGAYTTDYSTFSKNFNGEMDEVRVWGTAICQAQIQNNLHCEITNYPTGLVAYFKFNQGLASCNNPTVTYADGTYTSGTLQNFALSGPASNWVAGYISGSCAVFTPLAITSYPSSINVQATNDSCSATVNFSIGVSTGCSDSAHITYSQNPGTSFAVGTTYEYVTVQDDFGNSQSVSFPITVTEATPPTLVLKDTSIALSQYGYLYLSPYDLIDTLYDNCTPQYNIGLYSSNTYFYCSNTGANSVTVTAYDQSGNNTTKTATVTILPYVGSAGVTASPNPQQYSDFVTLQATLYGAQNFYFNGCLSLPSVTFKIGSKILGTVATYPDYNGNLIATLSYQLTDIFPKKITATFSGLNSTVYSLPNTSVSVTLNGTPENATVDYIESQLLSTTTNKVTIPVGAQITDTSDGAKGDIRKSIVTFTIQPITAGATVIGSNTITVSSLEFLNSDHTSGVARGSFTVNTGGNLNAKFNVIVTVSNYYTGSTTAVVYVSKSSSGFITSDKKSSLASGLNPVTGNNDFAVSVSPNPSSSQFTLLVKSSNASDKINIRISDVTGKLLETFDNVSMGEIVQLGAKYHSGIYMAEISQGKNKKTYKLIKLQSV